MDDSQRIVKCGKLSLNSPGSFFKKRWHSKYLVLYDGSKSGVKRLELFDSEIKFKKQNPAKIIPLVDCVRVVTCQRQKTTYTFEVRTSDQFYLLAAQSFQDMNDWVNCLRLVAFGQSTSQSAVLSVNKRVLPSNGSPSRGIDVLLEKRNQSNVNNNNQRTTSVHNDFSISSQQQEQANKPVVVGNTCASTVQSKAVAPAPPAVPTETHPTLLSHSCNNGINQSRLITASQAASAAANALSKTRQRQPSLLGSCKPQPPTDSPFIQAISSNKAILSNISNNNVVGQLDTLTPTVRGQLIAAASKLAANLGSNSAQANSCSRNNSKQQQLITQPTLDEEEENMLYCSIEDNPSEHNYRVKVIETELSLRCQLKCYQLTASTTINQQYEQLGKLSTDNNPINSKQQQQQQQPVIFYQLIIGPQELTLLNDYASSIRQQANLQQQGLWSWPYQCIRRYGFDKDNCFMFEAGRKCTSGPGQFIVQTPKAYSIYQDVVKFVNELRSLSNLGGLTEQTVLESQNSSSVQAQTKSKVKNLTSSQSEKQQQQLVITQIPVTWTPNSVTNSQNQERELSSSCGISPTTTTTTSTDTVHSRRLFFDTLRQLNTVDTINQQQNNESTCRVSQTSQSPRTSTMINGSNSQLATPVNSPTSNTMTDDITTRCSDSLNAKSIDLPALSESNRSEETDESGYEQGDESVTSSKSSSRLKLTETGNRKRQVNDSMSSASSTSSGGGSPGHSVSRRSNGAVHLGPINTSPGSLASPSKRFSSSLTTQNSISCPSVKLASTHNNHLPTSKLGVMLNTLADESEDFEANLIRDVYSEITKLHAKFAVTSGSTEDSLSSHSSNEDIRSGEPDLNDEQNHNMTDDQLSIPDGEPMYSNMKSGETSISRSRLANLNLQADELERSIQSNHQNRMRYGNTSSRLPVHQSRPQHLINSPYSTQYNVIINNNNNNNNSNSNNSYSTQSNPMDYLSLSRCGSIYPSILNPIPECGETSQQLSPEQSSTPLLKPQRNLSSLNSNENESSKTSTKCEEFAQNIKSNRRFDYDASKVGQSIPNQQVSAGPLKSKLPTNHYVINDVQYAKISRNLGSKYESCL